MVRELVHHLSAITANCENDVLHGDCIINGKERPFVIYVKEQRILPTKRR